MSLEGHESGNGASENHASAEHSLVPASSAVKLDGSGNLRDSISDESSTFIVEQNILQEQKRWQ